MNKWFNAGKLNPELRCSKHDPKSEVESSKNIDFKHYLNKNRLD